MINVGTYGIVQLRISEPDLAEFLAPCPFCGGVDDLELLNTHTPSYWVACACGAEMHTQGLPQQNSLDGHKRAAHAAVNHWNNRAGQ